MAGPPSKKPPPWIRHSGIGLNYAAAVAGFGLIGWWVESTWDCRPWGVLVGVALGLFGATYNLVRESMRAFEEHRDELKSVHREDQHEEADS